MPEDFWIEVQGALLGRWAVLCNVPKMTELDTWEHRRLYVGFNSICTSHRMPNLLLNKFVNFLKA